MCSNLENLILIKTKTITQENGLLIDVPTIEHYFETKKNMTISLRRIVPFFSAELYSEPEKTIPTCKLDLVDCSLHYIQLI